MEPPVPSDFVVVLVSVPDEDTGARIGRAVVGERLAACVNVLPRVRSIYEWEGRIEDGAEAMCVMKTRRGLYVELRARIEALHPYAVPEIIALPLADGNPAYLGWVAAMTAPPAR